MLISMTGYGHGEAGDSKYLATVEMRSVNNRFIDVKVRSNAKNHELDELLKSKIKKTFSRGFFDLVITVGQGGEARDNIRVNYDLLKKYIEIAANLKKNFAIGGELDINTLLRMNKVLEIEEEDDTPEDLDRFVLTAAEAALESLREMKEKEGDNIRRDFEERLTLIAESVAEIEKIFPTVADELRERLRSRIAKALGGIEIDQGRVIQEVAFMADRGDISEEITRLRSHMKQFRTSMDEDSPLGRKLEFVLQEMNRETNTVGSKSNHAALSEKVVLIKSELERIREQVQNIE